MIQKVRNFKPTVVADKRRVPETQILLKLGPTAYYLSPREAYELSNRLVDAAETCHYAPR